MSWLISCYVCECDVVSGFDNNGVKTGPRSTRLSNPEEHVTHYFNTYSKDMLVQVRWMVHFVKFV